MRRGIGIVALLLLLGALGAGGYYIIQNGLPWEAPPREIPTQPRQVAMPPVEDLPVPQLAGDAPLSPGDAVATLVEFSRTVKSKRAHDLAWKEPQAQMPLYDNDAVRTFERSSATLAFGADDLVEVDQNSLVIIKPRRSVEGEEEFALALLSPEFLDGLTSKSEQEQRQAIAAEAETKQVRIRKVAKPSGGSGKSRIALKRLPDKSTAVTSLSGTMKVVGPKGSEVTLKEKMVTKISPKGAISKPRSLLGAPSLASPRDGATYSFGSKPPQVEMSWKPVRDAKAYRIVVARDRSFKKIFADEKVRGTSFPIRNMQLGTYYWRVRAQDADGFVGSYSTARSLKAIRDTRPPKLSILFPPEMYVSPGERLEMKGKTDRGARIKVNGEVVRVAADGSFAHVLTLKEGVNLVTVEVSDNAGNFDYGKRVITYKGGKRTRAAGVSGGS
jgi:hypothetical protein